MGRETKPRILKAERRQLQLRPCDLESTLGLDHQARGIWAFVERLDLSAFYDEIEARDGAPGRSAIDPRILVCLWLYAHAQGVGSARLLARLCERDDAYRWICGGVGVNHHTLSDFRTDHSEHVDALLTQVLAVLMKEGLVSLERVAQDGTRVRASAGAGSFRRRESLERCLGEARERVTRLKRELSEDGAASSRRVQSARERAAREREAAVARALSEMPKVEAVRAREAKVNKKRAAKRGEPRVSTTDPEARVMKMADGGFRPAYNVQLATDTASGVIVGVTVSNHGSDGGEALPMLADIERRGGKPPSEALLDGGFVNGENIEALADKGIIVFAPVPKARKEGVDPHAPKAQDSPAVASWRERMGKDEAKEIYKQRAATAERVNADLKNWRGLRAFNVRGIGKVTTVVIWVALAFNILRALGAKPMI